MANNNTKLINSSRLVFVYQPIIGLNLLVSDHMMASLEYRYLRSANPCLTDAARHSFTVQNESHNVLLSLTCNFNAHVPPPATTPVAATAPPRMYFVFFDFDSARLTEAARHNLDEVASSYRQSPSTRSLSAASPIWSDPIPIISRCRNAAPLPSTITC